MDTWHVLSEHDVAQKFNVDLVKGLSASEAAARLSRYGANEIIDRGAKSPWLIIWEQVTAVMVLILLAAAGLSLTLQKGTEAAAILAIVVLFVALGFTQEYRAEKALAALKKMAVPLVRVLRSGVVQELSARELLPGDVILLEAGNVVPADVRIIESVNLRIQEAMLTGESEPVEKQQHPISEPDLPLGDRRNMGYMGTIVTYGRGRAVVINTGMRTELGKIATMIQDVKPRMTPLQQRLDSVGKTLAVAGTIAAALLLVIGVLQGESVQEMLLIGISVAVAVVPEGLPAVVTFTLALGAQRMLKRNALIRKLPAVETLGSVTTICSDKTGTLTENRMTVTIIDLAGHHIDLTEHMRHQVPSLNEEECCPELLSSRPVSLTLLLAGGVLCNDALLKPDPHAGRYHTIGDPTEGALLVAAAQTGVAIDDLKQAMPRVAELPFDSERKRMTTIHTIPAAGTLPGQFDKLWSGFVSTPRIAVTKGAIDGMIEISTQVWDDGQAVSITEDWRRRISNANEQMAKNGMRVLGIAFRPVTEEQSKNTAAIEQGLIFVGMVGMIDPPRSEVKAAVQTCIDAGIRPVMITGDHPLTASYIARGLGIARNEKTLTGQELARMSVQELESIVEQIPVYARVSPEHKLKIVEALQKRGHVVAMTGDGVNDAPALKKADIGVAMGITGTDVSKEASSMVLLDDNFSTIVAAVEEGRVIYDNVRRFVKFSIAGNVGKVAVMLFAPLLGISIALFPLQLLWLNLLTDGLLGLGLGIEPAERDTMKRPPYSPSASIFGQGGATHIAWVGLLFGIVTLGVGYWYYSMRHDNWQTVLFSLLAFLQVGHALAVRSSRDSLLRIGLFSNPLLLGMVVLVLGLQMGAIYIPFMQNILRTQPLAFADLMVCLVFGTLVFIAIEIEKLLLRRRLQAL